MDVRVLGALELVGDDGPIRLPARKQRRLLTALVMHLGEAQAADVLIDAVWGESPPPSARKLLQLYVSRLRRALPAGGRIVTRESGYALELDRDCLDSERFERLLEEGRAALREGNAALAASLFGRALALWRGPAYADFAYDEFARAESERLEEVRLVALEERIAAQLMLGRHGELYGELRGLATAHPLRERLQAQAMLALYRCGRQSEALELYAAARARLDDELGLEPGAELRELQRRILQQDHGLDLGAIATEPVTALPSPPNALLGRERELEELRTLLTRAGTRLLVLTGAGGSGKMRLALELARETAPFFANGAAFVELAPVRDAGLVVAAISRALDIQEVPDQEPSATLVAALRPRELLLVVDNAEHLRAAAPTYVDLLARAPRLTLLITSRAVLHLSGERVYPVEPLSEDAAVALFLERAREADPRFSPELTDEDAIPRICARLDGLPLAIELAASRVRTLAPAELLARLDPRLPLLTGGPRDLPARQQTLRATLDWSFELLEEVEQRDLIGLAVFAGGCTLEAAEAVCGTTVERLASLVDHNLLRRTPSPEGSRYAPLETVREYAASRLDETGGRDDAARRHAAYFLAVAERSAVELVGPRQAAELARLELEHDNLRGALAWMLRAGESELALRLASALWRFWFVRGHFAEGRLWLERALETADRPPRELLAQALGASARLNGQLGNLEEARDYAERSLELSRSHGQLVDIRSALGTLAAVLAITGELDRAAALHEEAIEISRQSGDRHGEAINLENLGYVRLIRRDYERSESLFRQSAELFRELGHREPLGFSPMHLALVALHQRRYDEAAELLGDSLAVCQEVGSKAGMSYCLEALAAVAVAQDRADDAAVLVGCAQQVRETVGLRLEPYEQALHDRTVLFATEALGGKECARQQERGRGMTMDEAIAYALDLRVALAH